jgi:pilus assembly protein CpaB
MFLRNVLLAVGAVFVLAGVGLMITWFGQVRNPPAAVETRVVAPEQQQAALVAAHNIPRGTKLREEDVKDAAPGELHPGSLRRGEEKEFLDKPVRRDIAEGDPLIPDDFKPCEKLLVARGYRALSISVDPAQSVAGLAVEGDYVDVLLTQTFADSVTTDPRRKWAGETVLRDVQVLATDQSLCPPSGITANVGAVGTRTPQTITLALKERQAEVLMVAGKLGTFQLAVRPHESAGAALPEDKKAKPVWASDVSPALTEILPPPPPPPPQSCNPDTGSTIDSVRCPPGNSSYYHAPMASGPAPKPELPEQWPGRHYAPPN